ncbi:LacI-family transcriptional regulator [Kutzneria sp. 744]|nr:LacI-family transcriptional regulator [Kutzneria sp. 744]
MRGDTPTLAEIAREAGVSTPTVSKVLNGRSDVAPGTRARVEELLQRHGYRRRAGGPPARLFDLVFHELESAWAMEVIRGVENVARQEKLNVVLSESAGRLSPGQSWVDGVLARRPCGVVLVLSDLDAAQRAQLASRDIPFVVLDPAGDPAEGVPAVGTNNWRGGVAATRHLIDLGHRRIGLIGGPSRMLCSRARLDGYRAALETAGLPYDPRLVREGDFHFEAGYSAGRDLLSLTQPPSAVFAGNDLQALGALRGRPGARSAHPRRPQRRRLRRPPDGPVLSPSATRCAPGEAERRAVRVGRPALARSVLGGRCARAAAMRCGARAQRPRRGATGPAGQPRHPFRGPRSRWRPGRRRARRRHQQLARRRRRHPPPHRPGAPPASA